MSTNPSQQLVPLMQRLWLSPVGTIAPLDPVCAMPVGWYDVGLFPADSLGWAGEPAFEESRSAQSNYVTRRWQVSDDATIQCDLQQFNGRNLIAVHGGGTITTVPAVVGPPAYIEHYKFRPPAIGGRTETAACMEIIDGLKHYRFMIPRAQQTEGVEFNFDKAAVSTLPLRLGILGSDLVDPYYMLTDDEAFELV